MHSLEAPEQPHACVYKRRVAGQMRCTNMAADSKTQKKLGHNLTVTRAVLLPKTRLQTTAGTILHFEFVMECFAGAAVDRAGGVGRRPGAL